MFESYNRSAAGIEIYTVWFHHFCVKFGILEDMYWRLQLPIARKPTPEVVTTLNQSMLIRNILELYVIDPYREE
jgi:hypothetical protein